jgi:hypothetical protein
MGQFFLHLPPPPAIAALGRPGVDQRKGILWKLGIKFDRHANCSSIGNDFSMAQLLLGHGFIIEGSRPHSDTPHSVGFSRTSDQPDAGSLPDNTKHSQETNIHAPAGFEHANPASEGR